METGMISTVAIGFKKSLETQKRKTMTQSLEFEPAKKRRLLSGDSFCFSLEDLTNNLYKDTSIVHQDESLYEDHFCFWCDAKRYEATFKCPYHEDKTTNQPIKKPYAYHKTTNQPIKKPYAYQNIPSMLKLEKTGDVTGVWTVNELPAGAWIGPYEGPVVQTDRQPVLKNNYMWEIFKDGKLQGYIDGSDENKSSWMRFIRRAHHQQEQNLWAFQYQDKVYYKTHKAIPPGKELLVWYDQQYLHYAGINNKVQKPQGEQVEPVSQSQLDRYLQMETTFNKIASLVLSPSKQQPEFACLSSGETTTTPSRPVPRLSTGFALKIKDGSFASSPTINQEVPANSPAKSSTSSTPNSSDSVFTFDSNTETTENQCAWRCGQCEKSFAQRAMLRVHVCGNVPFKPYKCGHCDKSFASAGEMRAHAVVHQGKKPFKCGYCARSFTGATTLNNHIRLHTGEKPFKCDKCGKSFSQGSQLSKHEKIPGDCIPKKK